MEKKIIELAIIDDMVGSGIDAIALVDEPAIEHDWVFFKKQEFSKISFDFDGTLSTKDGLLLAEKYKAAGDTLYIISARDSIGQDMLDRAKELGIPESKIFATGSNENKVQKVKNLGIKTHIDNNGDVISKLGSVGMKFNGINYDLILERAKNLGIGQDEFESGFEFNMVDENDHFEFAGYSAYKYEGDTTTDSRDFCQHMVSLNKFYTFDEIQQLSANNPNPGFGLGGADNYSIWKYKGGPNCKHRWQKYYITPTGTFQDKGPAPNTPGVKPEDMPHNGYAFNKFAFADESKHEIVGLVAIPDMEIPRIDDDTKEIYYVRFSKDVIQRCAEKFMRENRLADNNVMHNDGLDAGSYIYESWIVEDSKTDKANSIYKLDAPVGSWAVKMRVTNESTWDLVKSGKLRGFSLQGNFVTQEEANSYMKDKKMFEDLRTLVGRFK